MSLFQCESTQCWIYSVLFCFLVAGFRACGVPASLVGRSCCELPIVFSFHPSVSGLSSCFHVKLLGFLRNGIFWKHTQSFKAVTTTVTKSIACFAHIGQRLALCVFLATCCSVSPVGSLPTYWPVISWAFLSLYPSFTVYTLNACGEAAPDKFIAQQINGCVCSTTARGVISRKIRTRVCVSPWPFGPQSACSASPFSLLPSSSLEGEEAREGVLTNKRGEAGCFGARESDTCLASGWRWLILIA